ncbi:hypothetical protein HYN56_24785 [Flavobacterium crocinum]|uniref:ParB/Sulfiredoxin domain-containing protein n=1 Tax=Flavobacterium crocinum TaxID=2183896 RepID=A0A2S1YT54_9FLAO|nr:hypothetical protein [Flavobacterium crocinum]AWK07271.1 hypothetical protein HYN56_24785 [Flavobacterium crocinum]
MIEITAELIKDFLNDIDIKLVSTHNRLSLPVIKRIYKKMKYGIKFDEIKICDHLVIDGHHRYLSSLLAQIEIGTIKTLKTSATKEYKWDEVEFDENDWDTNHKIQYLNEKDAAYNELDVEIVNRIISE